MRRRISLSAAEVIATRGPSHGSISEAFEKSSTQCQLRTSTRIRQEMGTQCWCPFK